jgi:uncharacterized protein YdaU (DUF1376 family)
MNFYKHHIGDYDQATRHLSFVEDAAYSRLIRKYYAEESPLPAEVRKIERLIGARTKEEKQAVATILEEFFELQDDGWHNKRCDEELGRANAQAEANRKIAIEREAKKRARIEQEQSTNRDGQKHESWSGQEHESFKSREPSQTPDSRHQTPDKNLGAVVASANTSRGESDDRPASFPRDPAEWVRYFRERHGVEINASSVHERKKAWPIFTAWTTSGVSTAQVDAAVAKARAESRETIAFLPGYADRVLASMATPQRQNPDARRREISEANGAAWLAGETSDPNTIDMEH